MIALLSNILSIVFIAVACSLPILVAIYCLIQFGKRHKAINDLIYLERLIRRGECPMQTIREMLTDYLSRAEYQCDKLKYIKQLFDDKYKVTA